MSRESYDRRMRAAHVKSIRSAIEQKRVTAMGAGLTPLEAAQLDLDAMAERADFIRIAMGGQRRERCYVCGAEAGYRDVAGQTTVHLCEKHHCGDALDHRKMLAAKFVAALEETVVIDHDSAHLIADAIADERAWETLECYVNEWADDATRRLTAEMIRERAR